MKSLISSALLLAVTVAFGQQPGSIDPTFNPLLSSAYGYGISSQGASVNLVAKQPDGKLLVAGNFYSYNNMPVKFLTRLNADGSMDMDFDTGSGPNETVETIAPLANGKVLIGGLFSEYNGTVLNTRMVMLNADGSIDTSFSIGDTNQAGIVDIKVQPDGKFLVAGDFTSYDGYNMKRIVRLNADGTVDTSFSTGTGPNGGIGVVMLQPDGKILVGGSFTSISGTSRNRLARLNPDGSLDTTFNPGSGFDAPITDILLQPDGKIVIGGYFYHFQGVERNGAVRIDSSGTIDTTFDPENELFGLGLKPALNNDGNVIMVSADGTGIQTLNADGTVNEVYPLHSGISEDIRVIKLLDEGKVFIGGLFYRAGNLTRHGVAVLNADFTPDAAFSTGTGPDYPIARTIELPDGKKLICGAFSAYNDIASEGIARLTEDGDLDPTFVTDDITERVVYDMQVHDDGKITIAGIFYDGTTLSRIAQLNSDGTTDTNFMPGTGPNDMVNCLQILQDGKVLVGGYFNQYNGIAINSLARINADGSLDTTFNAYLSSGFNLTKIVELPDGKIIIAGNAIDRLQANGLSDFTFNPPLWIENSFAYSINVMEGGKLLLAGFTPETNDPYIVRLNADGTIDDTFEFFDPPVITQYVSEYVIVAGVQPDGKILVYMGDEEGMHLVRITENGALDESFDAGSGIVYDTANFGGIYQINSYATFQADGKILVSGGFGTFSGALDRHIARLWGFDPAALEMDSPLETAYCAGETLQIPFTASGDYGVGNVFTAQLSDANGNFENPAVMGNITLSESGTLEAVIPADTPGGTGYKIRLIASYPALETESTGVTFTVYNTPVPTGNAQQTIVEETPGTTTIADIDVTGEDVVWYASVANALSGTDALADDQPVVSGQTYYATQTLNGCTSMSVLAVTVTTTLTLNDFAALGITLHPNPVVNTLYISAKEDITAVAVYNMLGQQVSATWNSTSNNLNMASLQAGSYVVKVTIGNATGSVLVVKK